MKRWFNPTLMAAAAAPMLWASVAHGACERYAGNSALRAAMERAQAAAYYDLNPAKALEELESAQALLGCMSELVPTSDLAGLYLRMGALLSEQDRPEEADAALGRAASVSSRIRFEDPALSKATMMAFLSERDARFLMQRPSLTFEVSDPTLLIAIDGQPISTHGVNGEYVPGWHLVQSGKGGRWTGTWVSFPEGGHHILTLDADGASLAEDPGGAAAAVAPPSSAQPSQAAATAIPADQLRKIGIGLGVAATLPGIFWVGAEGAYRLGRLFDATGAQIPSYPAVFLAHRVAGVSTLAFTAASATTLILAKRRGQSGATAPPPEQTAGIQWLISPAGVALSGRF